MDKLKSGTQSMQALSWWNVDSVHKVSLDHANSWRLKSIRAVEYHAYTRRNEPDASTLSMLSWNVPGRSEEVAVTKQYVHPLKRGASMRNFFQFLLDTFEDRLPAHELMPLVRKMAERQGDLFLPCHAIHKGKRIGYLMGYELYEDYLAFLSGIECMEPSVASERHIMGTMAFVPADGKTQSIVLALAALIKNRGLKHGNMGIPIAQPIKDDTYAPPLAGILVPYHQLDLQRASQANSPTIDAARLLIAGDFPQEKGEWYEFFAKYWAWSESGRQGEAPSLGSEQEQKAKKVNAKLSKPKLPPPPLLDGLTAAELLAAVRQNGVVVSELEGLAGIILREVQERTAPKKSRAGARQRREDAEPRLLDMTEAAVRSKIAVMEWKDFCDCIESRRYPATKWLEKQLGWTLDYRRGDTVIIGPERLGELPALVAGRDKPWADRLYVVRIDIPADKEGEEPTLLAAFPAGWLDETEEWWMPGLFGTPIDPTLRDFCDNLPADWWERLRKAIPSQPAQRRLNVRTLGPSEDAPNPDKPT